MKAFVTSIALAFALSISPLKVNAQDRESPRKIQQDRRDAERNRQQQDRANEAFGRQQNTRLDDDRGNECRVSRPYRRGSTGKGYGSS
jgi:hypothetical protein